MNVIDQLLTENYAIYNGDCCEVIREVPDESIHLSLYSPPFCGLFQYSSSERDMSNARSYDEFFLHYDFLINQIHRVAIRGRHTAVHCMDVPSNGANLGGNLVDFPGDIIRQHTKCRKEDCDATAFERSHGSCGHGWFEHVARYCIWKEPLAVRNRTMAKSLAHRQVVEDSSLCDNAGADYLLIFRKKGVNPIPIAHPVGLLRYAGERQIPEELLKYKGWKGKQTGNRYSHWIWRQYASAFWNDIRGNTGTKATGVLRYKEARDAEDEKHLHPLQLDVIERCCVLWSNPGETVLTPFMGVGSEVFGAVINGRRGIGIELKSSYFRQAVKNLENAAVAAKAENDSQERDMFSELETEKVSDSMD